MKDNIEAIQQIIQLLRRTDISTDDIERCYDVIEKNCEEIEKYLT